MLRGFRHPAHFRQRGKHRPPVSQRSGFQTAWDWTNRAFLRASDGLFRVLFFLLRAFPLRVYLHTRRNNLKYGQLCHLAKQRYISPIPHYSHTNRNQRLLLRYAGNCRSTHVHKSNPCKRHNRVL
nr:hypothetical protein [Neisseria meningitidis]